MTAEHLADDLFFYAAQLGSGIADHPLPLADTAAYPGGSVGRLMPAVDPGDDPWEALLRVTGRRGAVGRWRWWNDPADHGSP